MLRKGNCADNGACESFFGLFKAIVGFDSKANSAANFKKALAAIDFYNTKRVQLQLVDLHQPCSVSRTTVLALD